MTTARAARWRDPIPRTAPATPRHRWRCRGLRGDADRVLRDPVRRKDLLDCGARPDHSAMCHRLLPREHIGSTIRPPGASAWQMEPWLSVSHRIATDHDVPLWTPYQGIGSPLAANMQDAVFDPLLLAAHLKPTPLVEDATFLIMLMGCAVAAYWAARRLRLSPLAATVVGCAFGASGWFFEFSNNQWFSTYLFLPIIIGAVEAMVGLRRRWPLVHVVALGGRHVPHGDAGAHVHGPRGVGAYVVVTRVDGTRHTHPSPDPRIARNGCRARCGARAPQCCSRSPSTSRCRATRMALQPLVSPPTRSAVS